MIVDSSALIGLILREPGFPDLVEAIQNADIVGVGAPTLVETSIVLAVRLGPAGRVGFENLVLDAGIEIVAFGAHHYRAAATAFDRFGKGRHPARLNFGDCMSYAVAQLAAQPLLCLGDDFARTDLPLVALPTRE